MKHVKDSEGHTLRVGARVIVGMGYSGKILYAHRRCVGPVPKQKPLSLEEVERDFASEGLTGPAVTSKTSMHHLKTTKFSLSDETLWDKPVRRSKP